MRSMFIFYNDALSAQQLGEQTVHFTDTQKDYKAMCNWRDTFLARGDYNNEIPSCTLVEEFVKRADKEGPGDNGNDWVFVNAWAAPFTREEALIRKYGSLENI